MKGAKFISKHLVRGVEVEYWRNKETGEHIFKLPTSALLDDLKNFEHFLEIDESEKVFKEVMKFDLKLMPVNNDETPAGDGVLRFLK